MSRLRQPLLCLAAVFVVVTVHSQSPHNSDSSAGQKKYSTAISSPVDFFRQLLALPPEAQEKALASRPPAARERIIAKLAEYESLDPDERELRLRATELHWWLMPMLRAPAAERAARLAQVPANLRELVESRLMQWSILPPPLQDEILSNETALHYFALVETTNQPAATAQQQRIAGQFSQFFELTPAEKEQTLNTLSEAERAQMQATLKSFEKLPPQQRLTCVRNYAKFAGMGTAERAEFLKNAESWSKMSPSERQAWRDLVQTVPIWPPLPPGFDPPNPVPPAAPPLPPGLPSPGVATNSN
jgi:hypothetical protein